VIYDEIVMTKLEIVTDQYMAIQAQTGPDFCDENLVFVID
jgi:hypothetical protein